MKKSKIFEVYEDSKGRLYTINLTPGKTVYGERLVKADGVEYREWNASKSKLAATILKGSPNVFIRKNDVILYLGCSSGTTVSHVSDIVGSNGFVFALDFAPRMVRDIVFVCEERKNIAPILADANKPDSFVDRVCQVDVIYQDIAQRSQVEIFLKNVNMFLKKEGYGLLAIKARSIDVTKRPRQIFAEIRQKLEKEMTIVDSRTLEPFQMDHCMFICKKK
ncbi:MAG: fibrillarin-like rRNA/tRNA 2'-O-methyltransferase [Nanoarchaeota archaeon]|nr:fibrillarin-like rRNA/tRNA 2'-O-methyltransferase [Nanoarchaeota archaeon]MBU1945465.1 fibrillarin-like rRNA/tRNA 2'-O-methyltransferase [Nanoarchaeota archaeon]